MPRLRLWRDALERSGRAASEADRSFDGEEKFDVPTSGGAPAVPRPLAACYLLAEGEGFGIERLCGASAVAALSENTYRGAYVSLLGPPSRTFAPACVNPGGFGLDYAAAELAGTYKAVTLKGAYEALEGDGVRGFATSLATLHAFQGWADVFLATPADGVEDRNLSLTFKPRAPAPLKGLTVTIRRHEVETQRTGASLGSEWDLMGSAALTRKLTAVVKFADYDGVPGFASRTKVWLGVEFKL